MNQLKSFLQKHANDLPGFITGAVTAGVLYVCNHVLHIPVLKSGVENTITPFVGVLAGALVSRSKAKASTPATVTAPASHPNAVVAYLTQAISDRLASSKTLEGKLVGVALGELHDLEAQSALVKDVVLDAPKIEAAVKALTPPAPTPAPAVAPAAPAPVPSAPVAAPAPAAPAAPQVTAPTVPQSPAVATAVPVAPVQ